MENQIAILTLLILSAVGYGWIKFKQKAMNDPLKDFQPRKFK